MSSPGKEGLLADEVKYDDELSLFDMVGFVQDHRAALLGGAIIGSVLGLAITFALPAEWEATTLLRVGQIPVAEATMTLTPGAWATTMTLTPGAWATTMTPTPVEKPVRVVDRIMDKSFREDVLKRLGLPPDESNPQRKLFSSSLNAKLEKSDLVSIYVRGGSPDEAALFANVLIEELRDVHAKMAEPDMVRWRTEAEDVDLELKRLDSVTVRLDSLVESQSRMPKDTSSFQAVLANYLLMSRNGELRFLRERKRVLQEYLSSEHTFATGPITQIYVPVKPVFPKKSIFAALGLMVGLLAGVLLSVLRPSGIRRNVPTNIG